MPWLFYEGDTADDVLTDRSVSLVYKPGMTLTLVAAKYTVEGQFVEMLSVTGGDIQVCLDRYERLQKAFEFGLGYEKSVILIVARYCFESMIITILAHVKTHVTLTGNSYRNVGLNKNLHNSVNN